MGRGINLRILPSFLPVRQKKKNIQILAADIHSNYAVAATCFKAHSGVTALIAIIGDGAFPRSFQKTAKIQCQANGEVEEEARNTLAGSLGRSFARFSS